MSLVLELIVLADVFVGKGATKSACIKALDIHRQNLKKKIVSLLSSDVVGSKRLINARQSWSTEPRVYHHHDNNLFHQALLT